MNPSAFPADHQLHIPSHSGYRSEVQAIGGFRKRFASFHTKKTGTTIPKHSIKFSANNFVTQCYDSFSKHYEVVELLGEGGYGEVYVCRHKETGAERAVKVLKIKTEAEKDTVLSEFNILRGIDHPNLLKIYQLYEDPEEDTFYIVSDLYQGGELYDEIEQWGHFVEEDAAVIMNQVLSCLNYFHEKGICHRDLKPENILLADNEMNLDDIKIIDFGLAEMFEDYSTTKFTEKVGSSYYIAPEVLKGSYGPKCDVWSCGVIAYILLCGEAPFDGDDDEEIMEAVLSGEFSFTDNPVWDEVSDDAKDFVEHLLVYDDNERPTAEAALRHPWLENARRNSFLGLKKKDMTEARKYLSNLERFHADTKLKQAVCAFISSQLILKHEKDVIDEIFRHMDRNCDGKVSKEELKQGFKELLGRDISDDKLNDIFQRVNYSSSGAIEYSEFVVASIDLDEVRIQATFNEFAKGKDVLTDVDLLEALAMKKGSDAVVKKIMHQIHTDQEDSISYEEFKSCMLQSSFPNVSSSGQYTFTAFLNPRRKSSVASRCSIGRASHVHATPEEDESEETEEEEEEVVAEMRESAAERRQHPNPDTIDAMLKSLQSTLNHRTPRKIKTNRNFSLPHAMSISYARRPSRTRTCHEAPGR